MTRVRNDKFRINRTGVLSIEEIDEIIDEAENLPNEFYRSRAKALVCILTKTGKRMSEIARLKVKDFTVSENYVSVRFVLSKKRVESKMARTVEKDIPLNEYYGKLIVEHLEYLKTLGSRKANVGLVEVVPTHPKLEGPEWFFPRSYYSPITGKCLVSMTEGLTQRSLFNILRSLSTKVWPHLFRERAAAVVIDRDPSIIGAFKVQRRLDLKDVRTGFAYLQRYAKDRIEIERDRVERDRVERE